MQWQYTRGLPIEFKKRKIGETKKVYVEDIVVKSKVQKNHLTYLQKSFNLLWKYNMKLNPEISTFRIVLGKFLGFWSTNARMMLI